jgi:hypothetical protein
MRKKIIREVMGVSTPNEGVSAPNKEESNEVMREGNIYP